MVRKWAHRLLNVAVWAEWIAVAVVVVLLYEQAIQKLR